MGGVSRIGQLELARALGLSQATVSLALTGHPRISAATRRRVREAADRLGYQPDPLASALAELRHRRVEAATHGNLAVVSSNRLVRYEPGTPPPPPGVCVVRHLGNMIDVAARRHGYHVELMPVGLTARAQRAACRMLKARGVVGLVVTVGDVPAAEWDFDWNAFSVVDLSGLGRPSIFSSVATHHFESMTRILEELRARGYRRPGLWLDEWFDAVPAWTPLRAGFALGAREGFEAAVEQTRRERDLGRWLARHRVDALVSFGTLAQRRRLEETGWLVPAERGFAGMDVDEGLGVSGIVQDLSEVGEKALALLDGLIRQGVRGRTEKPLELLVPAGWQDGETLRPRRA